MRPVICFGEALIDFLGRSGDQARLFEQHAGGAPANVAVAIARLGGASEFAGMLANDLFGDFLLESLVDAGVGTGLVRRTALAPTALAFVALDADGERSFSFYRPPAADLLYGADDFDEAALARAHTFHACSNSLTEEAIAATTITGMAQARAAGALVSFDINLRPALWGANVDPLPRLWQAFASADLVKLSAEEMDYLAACAGNEAAVLANLWRGPTQLVVVTHGAAPLRWFARDAAGIVEGFRVATVDTNAAGDAFMGGLLLQLATQDVRAAGLPALVAARDRFEATMRFASACGALATTRHGAFGAMPARADVDALLEQQPVRASALSFHA